MNKPGEEDTASVWRLPEWRVSWEDSVQSTMDWARDEARAGAADGRVFAAREQTAGRGRTGRTWSSPKGGLYASVLLRRPPKRWASLLPLLGAWGVREGLAGLVPGARFSVKWPNDVLAEAGDGSDRSGKIAGVLTEATAMGASLEWVVIGFGVNLDLDEDALPQGVDPPAVSVRSLGQNDVDPERLLKRVLMAFEEAVLEHADEPEGFLKGVEGVLAYRGQKVQVVRRNGQQEVGVLKGVSSTGDALVKTDDGELRLAAWDVERLRQSI